MIGGWEVVGAVMVAGGRAYTVLWERYSAGRGAGMRGWGGARFTADLGRSRCVAAPTRDHLRAFASRGPR